MTGWRECKLGDVVNLKRGYDLPHQERQPGPFPVVSSSGITDHHAEAKVKGPGVVTGRYGTLGDVFFIPGDFWPLNTSLYVQDFKGNDRLFVSYLLRSLDLGNHNAAGAVPGVNRNHLHLMDVRVPDPSIQRRIAGAMAAYDALVDNNSRRIRILEDIARALYIEWFVHFRLSGRRGGPPCESNGGSLPRGWAVTNVGAAVENFDRLRKPLSKMQRASIKGEYPYFGAAKVFDHINDYLFDGEYLLLAEDGSVITEDRAPVLQLVNERFWPNNHTHVLRGRSPFSTHLLFLALSQVDISPYITGAAQPKITQENMNRIPLVRAPERVHEEFDALVAPMIRQVQVLHRKTANLRRTRDLLLPRLLSGQLDASSLPETQE